MKVRVFLCAIIIGLAGTVYAQDGAALKEKKDRLSYTIGVDVAKTLKKQSIELDMDQFVRAMKDVYSGGKLRLTDQEMTEIKAGIEKDATDKKSADAAVQGEKNRKEEEKFLAENKRKEGVVCLPSGLQYKILKPGSGPRPKEDDSIAVHYRVMRMDESEIESSYKKTEPETFSLENVVPGWREGAMLMTTGSKWRLFVPSKLAYGEDGVGEIIGPNTMLIFDLELVRILEKPAQQDLGPVEKSAPKQEAKTD